MILLIFIVEKQGRVTFAAKAAGDSSESSTSLSIVESVQNVVRPPNLHYLLCLNVSKENIITRLINFGFVMLILITSC